MKKLVAIGLALTTAVGTVSCGSKDVTVQLPVVYVDTQSINELADDLDLESTSSITMNEDGSATVILTEKQRQDERDELAEEFQEEITDLYVGDDKIPSFVNIEYDKAYTKFDVYVDSATFTEIEVVTSALFFISGEVIQSFDGVAAENIDVQVNFIDNATKETLFNTSLKEFKAAE